MWLNLKYFKGRDETENPSPLERKLKKLAFDPYYGRGRPPGQREGELEWIDTILVESRSI
jgi:hypothetical protein